jgi:hypothetical protein
LAGELLAENGEEFARYRDAFYNFATLAGLSANWALAAFRVPEASGAARKFVESNSDMVSFLGYLYRFGAGETGLSGALEDNLAGPSLDAWKELEGIVVGAA